MVWSRMRYIFSGINEFEITKIWALTKVLKGNSFMIRIYFTASANIYGSHKSWPSLYNNLILTLLA